MADFLPTSIAFAAGGTIPRRHSCDGEDRSPPLSWTAPPTGSRSLALILDDPDAPGGRFVHWLAWGIPRTPVDWPRARGRRWRDGTTSARSATAALPTPRSRASPLALPAPRPRRKAPAHVRRRRGRAGAGAHGQPPGGCRARRHLRTLTVAGGQGHGRARPEPERLTREVLSIRHAPIHALLNAKMTSIARSTGPQTWL